MCTVRMDFDVTNIFQRVLCNTANHRFHIPKISQDIVFTQFVLLQYIPYSKLPENTLILQLVRNHVKIGLICVHGNSLICL